MSRACGPSPKRPWLVADIGGTNARFGLITEQGGLPSRVTVLRCADYPDLTAAVEHYLDTTSDLPRPVAACVAVAGPVTGDRFRLTNAHWDFSVADTAGRLCLEQLELVNDFTALAMSLPRLPTDAFVPIGGPRRLAGKPIAVIGPGTGLGVAALVPTRDGWLPVSGEGGHVTIPCETALEIEVTKVLRARHESPNAETMLSGPGIIRLYQALAVVNGVDDEPLGPEQVVQRGRHGTDLVCIETVRLFCALLGTFARNVALTIGAQGGVMLGGGILPTMPDVLAASQFRQRFEGTCPMRDYLEPIPTELIVAANPALLGASAWLADHREGALSAA